MSSLPETAMRPCDENAKESASIVSPWNWRTSWPLSRFQSRPGPSLPGPETDLAILDTALALEDLEAAYYNINVPRFFS